ncbi:hypothetical protein BC940DRAFT_295824 [Gongronella butleri]|nr:hypothetical protein BC940DRAFT_295824 [Gongronella butleri]
MYLYTMAYFMYSVYQSDKFQCLNPRKIFSGELKSICTVLMISMMSLQVSWDVMVTYIKYKNGFVIVNGVGISKPLTEYSLNDINIASIAAYIQAASFSIQTSLYFMLQCFWNYLSNRVAKRSFMSSFEFVFYIGWAIVTLALFPVLQWYYHYDPRVEYIIGIGYAAEIFITATLALRTHRRFRHMIHQAKKSSTNPSVISKLNYFKDINILMGMCQYLYSFSFFVFCIDGVTYQVIAQNKFASDCVLANININALILYILFIAVFHPLKSFVGVSTMDGSSMGASKEDPRSQTHAYSMSANTRQMHTVQQTEAKESAYKRFSRRVSTYIGDRFQGGHRMVDVPTTSFHQTFERGPLSPTTTNTPSMTQPSSSAGSGAPLRHESKTFLRPMSPMSVDYPASLSDTVPLTSYASQTHGNVSFDEFGSEISSFQQQPSSLNKPQYNIQTARHLHQPSPPPAHHPPPPPQPQPLASSSSRRGQYQSALYPSYYEPTASSDALSPTLGDQQQSDWLRSSPSRRQPRF